MDVRHFMRDDEPYGVHVMILAVGDLQKVGVNLYVLPERNKRRKRVEHAVTLYHVDFGDALHTQLLGKFLHNRVDFRVGFLRDSHRHAAVLRVGVAHHKGNGNRCKDDHDQILYVFGKLSDLLLKRFFVFLFPVRLTVGGLRPTLLGFRLRFLYDRRVVIHNVVIILPVFVHRIEEVGDGHNDDENIEDK